MGIFDFNGDGIDDAFEQVLGFSILESLSENEEEEEEEEEETFWEEWDLDPDDLRYMTTEEIRDVLRSMGLDPDNPYIQEEFAEEGMDLGSEADFW